VYWVGVDIGSLTVKIVAVDASRQVMAAKVAPAGRSGVQVAETLLAELPADEIRSVVATGYGRVVFSRADLEVSEITCHARGVAHLFPDARTVVDVGGQDSKAVRVAPGGRVLQFAMNERCAAGTGRFLEVMARALEVPVNELASLAMGAKESVPVSSTCTVFAESEVVGHLNAGRKVAEVAAGLVDAIAIRIVGLVRQVGAEPRIVMTGGVALNSAVVRALSQRLGLEVSVPPNPQTVGALGAALIALEKS
jgi:predicted CoA-substrate-specific enzyme activase